MSASRMPVNATGTPFTAATGHRKGLPISGLAVCFLLSGFAALIYQTAWTRQFSLVFGTSELAVATVLAAYMGGLALGAWAVERWLPRVTRPVRTYALLELGIAISAVLLVPSLLFASDWLLRTLLGHQPSPPDSSAVGTSLFYLLSAFVVLLAPTTLMGATLPLLARHAVRRDVDIGPRIGMLYALNTAGAVVGALLTAFWLLPSFGLSNSVRLAAVVNVLVFVVAARLSRNTRDSETNHAVDTAQGVLQGTHAAASTRIAFAGARPSDPHGTWPRPVFILPLILASGAVSFFHEVLWTRMLAHVLGSSLHAFGIMVASFLAGIAMGGALGARLATTRERAAKIFIVAQVACALTAAGAFLLMGYFVPPPRQLAVIASYGVLLLLPLTFCIGTTFPLAVRILAEHADDAASASARVYACTTVGAIAGSLSAGFVLIPWLRFEGAIHAAVALSCIIAVAATWLLLKPSRRFGTAVATIAVAIAVPFRPSPPDALLRASPLNIASTGERLFYDIGQSASVLMLKQDGAIVLRTNGLPEAMVETRGMSPQFSGEFWLSPIAVIARPRVQDMLIVGYGGGSVVENVPPTVKKIDVIELEPQVIAANRATSALRKRDPLKDPRVTIISNDARGALNLTERKYDAIVSQPSHPWTAGASHLYTLEFMRQARGHLTDDGVFVQWMNVSFLNEPLLRSLAATLLEAFGEVRLYRPDPNTLLFLASARPLEVEVELAASGRPLADAPGHFSRVGINTIEDVFAALAVDADGVRKLAEGAPLITDDDNRMATSSIYDFGNGFDAAGIGKTLAPYDPLRNPESWVFQRFKQHLSFPYLARRMAMYSVIDASVTERVAAMGRALNGTDGADIVAAVARGERNLTTEPDETIATARSMSAAGDWKSLATLDAQLAAVSWTNEWKLDSVRLRAEWRRHVASPPDVRRRAAQECISIVDQAIVTQASLTLLGLRAQCGAGAQRYDIVVESLWALGGGTYSRARKANPEQKAAARRTLELIVTALDKNIPPAAGPAPDAGSFDRERRDEIVAALRDRISRLE